MCRQLVEILHREMRDLTIRAGVSQAVYDGTLEAAEDSDLWFWLDEVLKGAYKRAYDVWKLHSPGKWAYYEMMEAETMTELQLLRSRLKELERTWRENGFKRKRKRNEAGKDQGEGHTGSSLAEGGNGQADTPGMVL